MYMKGYKAADELPTYGEEGVKAQKVEHFAKIVDCVGLRLLHFHHLYQMLNNFIGQ